MHLVGFIIRITYVTLRRLGKTFRVRLQSISQCCATAAAAVVAVRIGKMTQ